MLIQHLHFKFNSLETKMVDFSLKNKTALITGASRGIGEAIALTLAEHGAHCILVSRKIDALNEVMDKIKKAGGSAEAIACHMGHLDQIEAMFQELGEKHGGLDILVNNAATNPFFGGMTDVDEGIWDKTVAVNLKGPFFMIKHASLLMAKKGGGAIVNVASITGVSPAPFQGVYSMTKAGLISMTKAYANELAGFNIRVNALLPGLTKTKFSSALIDNDEIYKIALQGIPMNRHADPDEMTGAVLYLVSNASSFTTGTCIVCDGGNLI
jgi:NAD(P)-dependent dehydrogenase (short-subunit alcohol dehydrogenase family)